MKDLKVRRNEPQHWLGQLSDEVKRLLPHVWRYLDNESEFLSLRLKYRADGTTIAVIKRIGDDGGPQVAFGSGYGVFGALIGLDYTLEAGNWKPDKPWSGSK